MRALWFVAGAGAGVYLTVRARRAAEALTPEGLQDRLAGLSLGAQLFGEEVRAGMAEKETELRERLAIGPHGGKRAVGGSGARALGRPRTSTTGGASAARRPSDETETEREPT